MKVNLLQIIYKAKIYQCKRGSKSVLTETY